MEKHNRKLNDDYLSEWFPNSKITYKPKLPYKPYGLKIITTTLDLHGETVNSAYIMCMDFIENSVKNNIKSVTIITGRSGQIKKEFKMWISMNKYVNMYKQLPNEGSYKLWLIHTKL